MQKLEHNSLTGLLPEPPSVWVDPRGEFWRVFAVCGSGRSLRIHRDRRIALIEALGELIARQSQPDSEISGAWSYGVSVRSARERAVAAAVENWFWGLPSAIRLERVDGVDSLRAAVGPWAAELPPAEFGIVKTSFFEAELGIVHAAIWVAFARPTQVPLAAVCAMNESEGWRELACRLLAGDGIRANQGGRQIELAETYSSLPALRIKGIRGRDLEQGRGHLWCAVAEGE